jgi:hypothetical protein
MTEIVRTIKMKPLIHSAPSHEDVWRSGGIASELEGGVFSFMLRPTYPQRKILIEQGDGWAHRRSGLYELEKNPLPFLGIESRPPSPKFVTVSTEISWSLSVEPLVKKKKELR